jgi:hypothetical protein
MIDIIYIFLFVIIILIIIWICCKKKFEIAGYTNSEPSDYINYDLKNELPISTNKNTDILNTCQVPTLSTDQCYKSKFYECPIVNGSYLQCTNNYIPKPEKYNAPCENRTFEMTPYPWKISENCYYNKINFDRDKVYI